MHDALRFFSFRFGLDDHAILALKVVEGGEWMSFHAFIIGDIDQEPRAFCKTISNGWDQTPVYITQGTDRVVDFLEEHKVDAIFVRIDVASNNGLEITRFIKEQFPEIKLVWMSYSNSYAIAAFEESVDAFIELPMTHEKIQSALKRLDRRCSYLSDAM